MSEIRWRITGEKRVATRFRRMSEAARDTRPVWRRFARILAEHNAAAFATLGASNHQPWAPLSPVTEAWKLAHGFFTPPLVQTGAMESALTDARRLLRYSGRGFAYFEVDSDIYQYHHFGTRHMPRRRVMVITKELVEALAEAAKGHLVASARPGVDPGATA